jgi:hypothetical protein
MWVEWSVKAHSQARWIGLDLDVFVAVVATQIEDSVHWGWRDVLNYQLGS